MSEKKTDRHNRWRSKTVSFRVSPEEWADISKAVSLSGLTKQEYILNRLLCRDVVVLGNPRVYKALKDELAAIHDELLRIESGGAVKDELCDIIKLTAVTTNDMKEGNENSKKSILAAKQVE